MSAPARRTRALAPGKVNLCLFLGPTRADGYHDLVSLVQPVSLADKITLGQASEGVDEVVCPGVEGPNLVATAIATFRAQTGWTGPPQRVEIRKRVPVAAGMAGGSADAAAVLRLLAAEAGAVSDSVLGRIAARVGADVPALLAGGPCLTSGFGERVRRVPPPAPPGLFAVLASQRRLAARDVFAEADRLGGARTHAELDELATRVEAMALRGEPLPRELLVNDLEPAARSLCPSIDADLARLRAGGAAHAIVSGSGPTTVGILEPDDNHDRDRLSSRLRERLGAAVTIVEPLAGHPSAPAGVPTSSEAAASA